MPRTPNSGGPAVPERNNFFYGKLMDTDQFQKDQYYFNQKRWLMNRLVLGSGVVCGLNVVPDLNGMLRIEPGIAVDGLGREIVVPESGMLINPRQLTDDQGNPTGESIESGVVDICLGYAETLTDPVPVLVADCDTPGNCAPSTIREGCCALVRPAEDDLPEPPSCSLGEFSLPPNATLHKLLSQRISESCPEAPEDLCVPLARVTVPLESGGINSITGRGLVYANPLLYELILCLAGRIERFAQGRNLRYLSGDGQTGRAGEKLADPLVVELVDAEGKAIDDEIVRFEVMAGGGEVSPATTHTDEEGRAQAEWVLGSQPGEQQVTVGAVGTAFTVRFRATALAT